MIGLILKDWLNCRKSITTMFGVCLVLLIFAFMGQDVTFVSVFVVMVVTVNSVNAFSYDDSTNWNTYVLTMPISRKQVVASRYLASLGMMALGVALAYAMIGASSLFFPPSMEYSWLLPLGTAAWALLFLAVMLPFLYQFGAEKSRILSMGLMVAPLLVAIIWGKVGGSWDYSFLANGMLQTLGILVSIGTLLLYGISYLISCRIYTRKDY